MSQDPQPLVEHYFRHEYGRLVALLTRHFGVRELGWVEDIVQAALTKALQSWAQRGLPDDPRAWLYRTARNLAIDAMRRQRIESKSRERLGLDSNDRSDEPLPIDPLEIGDEPLRLLFLCCHPSIPLASRIALALKMVGGFSLDEVANGLLITRSNAEKRITRAKETLRDIGTEIADLTHESIQSRIESVEGTIYLLFNEGYASSSGDHALRRDLCLEAIRLARMLNAYPWSARPHSAALMALMLLHAARMEARVKTDGTIVLLEDQDRTQWNWSWIREAMDWMARSTQADQLTRYHLESAIAWEHCRAPNFESVA